MLFRIWLLVSSFSVLTFGSQLYDKKTVEYLVQYGYLDEEIWITEERNNKQIPDNEERNYTNKADNREEEPRHSTRKEILFERALKDFQMFVGIEPTGELDNATIMSMKKPRCGVKDRFYFKKGNEDNRIKRFITSNIVWDHEELTYRIYKYPEGLLCAAVDEVLQQAFDTWTAVTNVKFQQIFENADINIGFVGMNHTCDEPFKEDVIAHAGSPLEGTIHFNTYYNFTIRDDSGEDLLSVALHEIGHVLGLDHSQVSGSIMHSLLESDNLESHVELTEDDIQGIQSLYGIKRKQLPDLCTDSTFDAIFEYPAGTIYILKGQYYWKMSPDGLANGYPRDISSRWYELPSDIDAATATSSGLTYFFKGNKFWSYDVTTPHRCNPSYISERWPGIPDNVDGAMWGGRSLFYFFKGDKYWKYDSTQYPEVDAVYPKPLTDWGGIKGHLDDALYVNSGYIYFFTNGFYYRYNSKTSLIDYGHPNYPRATGPWWFRCEMKNDNSNSSTSSTTIEYTTSTSTRDVPTTTEKSKTTEGSTTTTDESITTEGSTTTTDESITTEGSTTTTDESTTTEGSTTTEDSTMANSSEDATTTNSTSITTGDVYIDPAGGEVIYNGDDYYSLEDELLQVEANKLQSSAVCLVFSTSLLSLVTLLSLC